MPYPPKGHPDRPLRLAARSLRALGVFLIGLALLVTLMVPLLLHGPGTPTGGRLLLEVVLPVLSLLAIGVSCTTTARHLNLHKRWAATVGSVLVAMGLLGCLSGLAAIWIWSAQLPIVTAVVNTILLVLLGIALVQLLAQLRGAFDAIRLHSVAQGRGLAFEPIMNKPPDRIDHESDEEAR